MIFFFITIAKAGTDAFAFLDFGIGGRALGMGNASVVSINDATSIYWNPAKLGIIEKATLSGFYLHQPLGSWSVPGDNNIFLAFILPVKKIGGIGLSFYQFKLADIEYWKSEGAETFKITDAENVLYLSYGHKVMKDLAIGVNLKGYYQSLDTFSSYGFSADFALHFLFSANLNSSLLLQSPGKIRWNNNIEKDEIPAKATFGISYSPFRNMLLEADIKTKRSRPLKICLGGEYSCYFLNFLTEEKDKSILGLKFRGGIRDISWENKSNFLGLSAGLGIDLLSPASLFKVKIDYALIFRYIFGISHAVGFSIILL